MQTGKFNILLDAFWGSSGKGKMATWLADKFEVSRVSSSNFPNAGHSAVFDDGTKFVSKAIPTASIIQKVRNRKMQCYISPGSGFNWERLISEWEETGKPRIWIHGRASLVNESHAARERAGSDSTKHIASTMQGSGAAISDKIMRRPDCALAQSDEVSLFSLLRGKEYADMIQVIDPEAFRRMTWEALEAGYTWLHEGSQGFALSIDHGSHYPNCLSADSRVLMADGTTCKIRDLQNQIGQEVQSIDRTGKIVNRKIINWWKHQLNDRDWYNVLTETSVYNSHDQQWIGPKFTEDHKIRTLSGVKKVSEIGPGDRVYTNEAELDGDGLQIFLGSILGDGCVPRMKKLKKRATLQISHGEKQKDYLYAKAEILSRYVGGFVRTLTYSDRSFKPGNKSVRYSSAHSLSVMRMATSLGCLGKKAPDFQSIIELIDWRGLAIWFQDDGSWKQGGNGKDVMLFTNGFEEDSVRMLAELLKGKFGLNFSVDMVKASKNSEWDQNEEKRYPVLRLSRHDHTKWFEGIQNFMHPCMNYKLPDGMQAMWSWKDHDKTTLITEVVTEVVKSRRRPHRGEGVCFDIEVEDTHNFFVSNDKGFFNVENCTSRNCTVQAAMDHMAVPPALVGDVYLNLRTFPIRVGNVYEDGKEVGFSGGFYSDCEEMTWEQIAEESGMPEEEAKILAERERTTVTKRVRRVCNFTFEGLEQAVKVNGATKLALNFVQYLDWKDQGIRGEKDAFNKLSSKTRELISSIEEETNVPVVLIGTGANHEDVISLL